MVTQYLQYSIAHLNKKRRVLSDLANQQVQFNTAAEELIKKQKQKIKEQEKQCNELTNNCMSMEYLIKHLKLEDMVLKLGIQEDKIGKQASNIEDLKIIKDKLSEVEDYSSDEKET